MPDQSRAIRTVAAFAGESWNVLGAPMVVKADPAEVGALVVDHVIPPGYGVPPHVHDGDDEIFHILSGTLTFVTPDGEWAGGPAGSAVLPSGIRHGFRNDGTEPVHCLVIVTPGVQAAEMFRHFDRAAREGTLAPEQIGAIAAQYGVRMG
ncbi:MAG: cupin domain-containing protein [Acetobacteraceae bacterium]|nr:cupin domain-containing protein [Acetobacteraceae bacterium]